MPTVLVTALKHAIHEVAIAKGISGARVLEKENARGETVIALILPSSGPGLLKADDEPSREEKRLRRMMRG